MIQTLRFLQVFKICDNPFEQDIMKKDAVDYTRKLTEYIKNK